MFEFFETKIEFAKRVDGLIPEDVEILFFARTHDKKFDNVCVSLCRSKALIFISMRHDIACDSTTLYAIGIPDISNEVVKQDYGVEFLSPPAKEEA